MSDEEEPAEDPPEPKPENKPFQPTIPNPIQMERRSDDPPPPHPRPPLETK